MRVWLILPTLLTLSVIGYVTVLYFEDRDYFEFFCPSKPYPVEKLKEAVIAVLSGSFFTLGLPVLSVWLSHRFGV